MHELMTGEQLDVLYTALDKLDAQLDDDRLSGKAQSAVIEKLLYGHRFAAVAAERLGDARFLERLLRSLRTIDGYELSTFAASTVGRVLINLLERAPVGPAIDALAASTSQRVREAVAQGLARRASEARPVLWRLAADRTREVRVRARAALKPEFVPPWLGVLSADPASLVDADTLEAARATLDTVLTWANQPKRDEHVLHPAVAQLPEALAVDLLERMLAAADDYHVHKEGAVLLAALMRWPSGPAAAWRVWSARDSYAHRSVAEQALTGLPPEEAADRALVLVAHVRALPETSGAAVECAAEAVEHGWPASADPRRLFEALVAWPDPSSASSTVRARLARGLVTAADPDIAAQLLTSLAAGDLRLANPLASARDGILAALPLEQRLAAARQAQQHAATIPWAVATLLEDSAATAEERAAWLRDPDQREHVLDHHLEAMADLLRAELLAGALSDEDLSRLSAHVDAQDTEAWDGIRARRDAPAASPALVFCLPRGPWAEADVAHVERLVSAAERPSDHDRRLAYRLAMLLSERDDQADAALRVRMTLDPKARARLESLMELSREASASDD